MAETKAGISSALDLLGATAEPDEAEVEQLAMFEAGPLGENLLQVPGTVGIKRRGRPNGARNRSTEEWREFLLNQHRSPLQTLLEIANMPLELLEARLGYLGKDKTKLDLLKVQIDAAQACLPYLHQKQPQAVELGDGTLPILLLGGEVASVEGGQIKTIDGEEITFLEIEEKQELSAPDDEKSNDGKSNEGD